MLDYLKKIFSSTDEASSKRFIAVILVFTLIISHFLVMYIPIEIKNKELVSQSMDNLFWLCFGCLGFITGEHIVKGQAYKSKIMAAVGLKKAETGTPDVVVQNQNVDNQNIPGQ
ncbi:MAG TPA: hypothetical protein VD794_10225 [Flavisolibacter sp.]|nr:hypothetical protein [Flavisolibacter sp.]